MTNLMHLNTMDISCAKDWFMQTCTASAWCELMTLSRPYASLDQVIETGSEHWQKMRTSDFIEAFEGHPMIGDIDALREKYAATKAIAGNEQAGTASASDDILQTLQQANKAYLKKHGFIFIICASGLSANTMLNVLQIRLQNTSDEEMKIAAQEQLKITLLRIKKALTKEEMLHE